MRLIRYGTYIVVALGLAIPAWGLMQSPSTSMEETSILQYASMAADGHVPTKDFWTEYGPLNVYAPATAFTVVGPSLPVERVVGLVYRAILLGAVFVIIRRYSRLAALLGLGFAWWMLAPWGAMAYAWIGGMGLGLASIAIITGDTENPSTRRLFLATLTAGLALSFRPDLIVALGVAAGVLLWPHRRRWKTLVGGMAVGLLPYVVLIATAGLGNVIRNLVVDPLVNLRDGRALPFPPSWRWNAEFFSRVQQYVDAMTNRNWYGSPLVVQIAELFWLLVVVAALIGVTTWHVRRQDRVLLSIGLFALLLSTNIYQRADISHMRLVGTLWLALAPLAIFLISRRWFTASNRVMVLGSASLAMLLVLIAPEIMVTSMYELATKRTSSNSAPHVLRVHDRTIITADSQELREIRRGQALITAFTNPGDRFIQGPTDFRFTNYNEPAFYWLNPQLVPGTYFLEMNPGISNATGSRMASDIASSDILLLSNRFEQFSEPNTSTVAGDGAANEVIVHQFCVAGQTKWYSLLRHTTDVVTPPMTTSPGTSESVGPNRLYLCGHGGTSPRR